LLVNVRYLKKLPRPEEIFVAQPAMADMFSMPIYLALLVRAGLLVGQTLGVIRSDATGLVRTLVAIAC
jgi:hypothetical protein